MTQIQESTKYLINNKEFNKKFSNRMYQKTHVSQKDSVHKKEN